MFLVGLLSASTHAVAQSANQSEEMKREALDERGIRLPARGASDADREYFPYSQSHAPPDDTISVLNQATAHKEHREWSQIVTLLEAKPGRFAEAEVLLLTEAYEFLGRASDASDLLNRILSEHESKAIRLMLIDLTLRQKQYGLALRQIAQAPRDAESAPDLDYRAAEAYHRMGSGLGKTRLVRLSGARPGRFVSEGLLLERRGAADTFLCCPPESAMYCLRRALDGGCDDPLAHCLHARLWIEAGRRNVAFAIVKNHETRWLESRNSELIGAMVEIALECDRLEDALRYARFRAALSPDEREDILFNAFIAAARRYNLRGEPELWRELLARAQNLRPNEVNLMLQLADACWETGVRDQAALWYRRVLEREPAHADRLRILERLEEERPDRP